jgi:hypothetical protein
MTNTEIRHQLELETHHLLWMLAEARGLDPKGRDTFYNLLTELQERIEKADAA